MHIESAQDPRVARGLPCTVTGVLQGKPILLPNNMMRDGKWHRIRIQMTRPQNRSSITSLRKGGYYAPENDQLLLVAMSSCYLGR
jgi:hypothetical protein